MGHEGVRLLVIALLNVALTHAIYPLVKRRMGRLRPFDVRFSLPAKPRDRLSFPSGHTMPLAATMAPFIWFDRAIWLPAAAAIALMSWARMACGHHYLSDVIGGAVLGLCLGSTVPLVLN